MEKNAKKQIPHQQWAQCYVLAGHWKDDLEFYCEDLQFLHHLVANYLLWITKPENLEKARKIEKGIFTLKIDCEKLLAGISSHLNNLAKLVDNSHSGSDAFVATTHGQLEKDLARFVKRFRDNRREVFKITECILDSEELPAIPQ